MYIFNVFYISNYIVICLMYWVLNLSDLSTSFGSLHFRKSRGTILRVFSTLHCGSLRLFSCIFQSKCIRKEKKNNNNKIQELKGSPTCIILTRFKIMIYIGLLLSVTSKHCVVRYNSLYGHFHEKCDIPLNFQMALSQILFCSVFKVHYIRNCAGTTRAIICHLDFVLWCLCLGVSEQHIKWYMWDYIWSKCCYMGKSG